MARTIDISAKLTTERPKLRLAEDKVYEINDRKNNVIKMENTLKGSDINDLNFLDEIIGLLLGEEVAKEIDEMDLSISDYQTIVIAIMAAMQEMEFEEAESLFRKQEGI